MNYKFANEHRTGLEKNKLVVDLLMYSRGAEIKYEGCIVRQKKDQKAYFDCIRSKTTQSKASGRTEN